MIFAPGECTEEEFREYELDRDSDGLYGAIQREMKQDDEEKERHFYGESVCTNEKLDANITLGKNELEETIRELRNIKSSLNYNLQRVSETLDTLEKYSSKSSTDILFDDEIPF